MNHRTSDALTQIARHHKEFINTARALYGNNYEVANYAEDFVQECYLKLSRYDNLWDKVIKPDGSVSKGYVFFCLRSVILNKLTLKRVTKYNYIGDEYDMEEKYEVIDQGIDPAIQSVDCIESKMYSIVEDNSDWFDYKLFKTYLQTGKSFRTLASETGLGIQTIYLSIKRSKLLIADKLMEDYQDFLNGDFDRI